MNLSKDARPLLLALSFVALAGCASVQPVAYSGIPSASNLKPNAQSDSGKVPYRYATSVNWSTYSKVIIDPASVYRGTDNQFGDMREEDKATLADYLYKTFSTKLATRFDRVTQSGPGTLRIKLILTGAEATKPVIGQFVHFDLGGNLYNGVQAVRGKKSAFGGSATFAVEIYDASTNKLLNAYVTQQYPNAMNLPASFGSLKAAKSGMDKGADALLAQLR